MRNSLGSTMKSPLVVNISSQLARELVVPIYQVLISGAHKFEAYK